MMLHIDLEPYQPIPESIMAKAVIEFRTADNSHPPTQWQLFDLMRLGSDQLFCAVTVPSHGMDTPDFYQWLVKAYADKKDITKLAVYFYKKIAA